MRSLLVALAVALAAGCAAPTVEDDAAPATADALTDTAPAGTTAKTTGNAKLRSGPSADASVLRVLDAGTPVQLTDGVPQNGFYAVTAGDDEGFVSGQYLALDHQPDGNSGSANAVLYFHGMSHLGFSSSQVKAKVGSLAVLAPSLSDAQTQGAVDGSTISFVSGHDTIVSGYSLGRLPVFRLMEAQAAGMKRVVLIDPTYDSWSGHPSHPGGGIAKKWLDGDDQRTFLFVYGDATVQLDGDDSYNANLEGHPRAELCYFPGDHSRFRQPDMAAALVATGCADLHQRLGL